MAATHGVEPWDNVTAVIVKIAVCDIVGSLTEARTRGTTTVSRSHYSGILAKPQLMKLFRHSSRIPDASIKLNCG